MTNSTWKLYKRFGKSEPDAVFRTLEDGRQESCLVTAEEYLKWLAEGNEPLPPDEGEA